MSLHDALAHLLQPAPGGRHLLALSGGLDSTVLLHLLVEHPDVTDLRALHVNHGMQPRANEWARHCGELCGRLGVPLEVLEVTVDPAGRGPEAAAREARYRVLGERMEAGDVLLTAQHADDQAETFLLQALRGAGPAGLAGMPTVADFGPGRLARPLLGVERQAIRAFAEARGLNWLEDPSNRDIAVERGWLRQRLWPDIRKRWPRAVRSLSRSARWCGEALELTDALAAIDLQDCSGPQDTLAVAAVADLTTARQANLLRYWLSESGFTAPDHRQLQHMRRDLLAARADAVPRVAWAGTEVRRHDDHLFAMATLPPSPDAFERSWDASGELELPSGCGRLQAEHRLDGPLDSAKGPFSVRLRRGGESLQLADRAHHSSLKTLLQAARVPPWVRERLPLVYAGGELAAVADLWTGPGFGPPAGQPGARLHWLDAPPGADWHRIVGAEAFC